MPYDLQDLTIGLMLRHGPEYLTVPVETSSSPSGLPTSLHLADGNSGEYRKSYHSFGDPSVAYAIDSPQNVTVIPMFIDTWNRDKMTLSGAVSSGRGLCRSTRWHPAKRTCLIPAS